MAQQPLRDRLADKHRRHIAERDRIARERVGQANRFIGKVTDPKEYKKLFESLLEAMRRDRSKK